MRKMQRQSWWSRPKPPKNLHSLENLKYLFYILSRNQTITENNKSIIVEAFRSMSEILIWGDQNDSSVFEFFLEKNMFTFFLNILQQNAGNYVCVQLLQTINIVFENLHNETSLYYMLSNNHVNEVICHKFDFSDEEVMAYYISFLKTLSLRLNKHTINFFYNEHTDDFALYTEAIKFFNHSESMVRIAVRTLTLNVYKVNDAAMLRFIRDKTGAPYFSNLTWFIAQHVRYIDQCVRSDVNHQQRGRLRDLVAEHLDYMHYINDILTLENEMLNEMLTDHLLHRLFFPLYIRSLAEAIPGDNDENSNMISSVVALFLLSQVFLILHNKTLISRLAEVILNNNLEAIKSTGNQMSPLSSFMEKPESIEALLTSALKSSDKSKQPFKRPNYRNHGSDEDEEKLGENVYQDKIGKPEKDFSHSTAISETVQEKNVIRSTENKSCNSRPFLDNIYSALNCNDNDYSALFALCLIYALLDNKGIDRSLKKMLEFEVVADEKNSNLESVASYSLWLKERLLRIVQKSVNKDSRIRLATLHLSTKLLIRLGMKSNKSIMLPQHLRSLEISKEASMHNLHTYVKEEEILLDIFEYEYRLSSKKPLNVEYLMMDSSLLLYPTGTPLTGIDFIKRLPCGESEQARRSIGVFFILRSLLMQLNGQVETQLPLSRDQDCIHRDDKLDLNNSDLIACTVVRKQERNRRFLVVDLYQIILVKPDSKKLGWGVVTFSGYIQDVEVLNDTEDSRCLKVTVHGRTSNMKSSPVLQATFIFDDHIRCMAAKQRLCKGRMRARHLKLKRIAALVGVSEDFSEDPFASSYLLNNAVAGQHSNYQFHATKSSVPNHKHTQKTRDTPPPTARVHPLVKRPGMAKGLPSQRVGSLGLPVKTPVSSSQQQSSKINSEDLNKSKVKNCSDLKTNEKREII